MYILDYLTKYGNKSFEELPFNELDALVFAELSYLNLEKVSPYFVDGKGSLPLKSLNIKDIKSLSKDSVEAMLHASLLKKIVKAPRFQDVGVGLGLNLLDEKEVMQYCSFTLFMPDGSLFLSFRGTDKSVAGWKEDIQMSYLDEIPSQKKALEYAEQVLKWYPDRKFYLGGHSKGGNLAFYVALNLDDASNLIGAYSFDGPGFRVKPGKLEERKDRLHKYLAKDDIVGAIYNNIEEPIIVYASNPIFGGHDAFSWRIDEETLRFKRASKRSLISIEGMKIFDEWLSKLSKEDCELFSDSFFDTFHQSKTIYDMAVNIIPAYLKRNEALKDYTKEERARIKEILGELVKTILERFKPKKKKEKAR